MRKKILLTMFLLLCNVFISAQEKVSTGQMPYAEGSTGNFEVVITYNNLEPNKEAKLTFYISDFKTNAPIENAKLDIDIPGIENSKINILPSIDPGIYEVLLEFPELKKYTILINITSGETTDLIAINDVDIGAKEEVIINDKESKSFFTILLDNLLFILISIIILSLIAFIFYKIGKRKSLVLNLNSDTKNIMKEIEL